MRRSKLLKVLRGVKRFQRSGNEIASFYSNRVWYHNEQYTYRSDELDEFVGDTLQFTFNAIDFYKVVSEMKAKSVLISVERSSDTNGVITITGDFVATVNVRVVDCRYLSFVDAFNFTMSSVGDEFNSAVRWVKTAVLKGDYRPSLQGLIFKEGRVAGTDGKWMKYYDDPSIFPGLGDIDSNNSNFVIPGKITDAITSGANIVTLGWETVPDDKLVLFFAFDDGSCMYMNNSSIRPPNIDRVIPKYKTAVVGIDISFFDVVGTAARAVKIQGKYDHPGVVLEFIASGIKVLYERVIDAHEEGESFSPSERLEGNWIVPADVSDKFVGRRVMLNVNYLLGVLEFKKGKPLVIKKDIIFGVKESLNCSIYLSDDPDKMGAMLFDFGTPKAVIMPMLLE